MATAPVSKERLISVDSHVHFTDEWFKARLSAKMQTVWDGVTSCTRM